MPALHLHIEAASDGAPVVAPVPLQGLGRRPTDFAFEGARVVETITSGCGQRAYLLQPFDNRLVLDLTYVEDAQATLPDWVWRPAPNSLSTASPELTEFARRVRSSSEHQTVQRLAEHVAGLFTYAAGDRRFTDGTASVPLVCSTTRGTCIDIHTYFAAALRAAGIEAAYMAGIFIAEGAAEAGDMHCWVAARIDGDVEEWDLSHAIIASRDPRPGLTEIAGRRVVLSSGRGIQFARAGGSHELSHLALPTRLDGTALQARATIAAA